MSEPILRVQGLTRRFGGLTAINDVSFEVNEGETLGVVGPNGAGKTTLFHCITGFERPNEGRVELRGVDVVGKRPHEIVRAGLARTFQIVRPFPDLPVIANVMVPLVARRVRDPRIAALGVLARVGLAPRAASPSRLLSEGDLKRLEIARAIATDPSLLLLDEPFAGLSSNEIDTLSEAIQSLRAAGTALIIVEHKLRELMRLVDRVIVLDQGVLIAQGEPRAVMQEPAVVEAYLGKGAADARP